uniref:Uncharacterized protein n=1 Tax=Glossina austeni TaxID=7395 RepID=A0A1A9VXH9_GLOAU
MNFCVLFGHTQPFSRFSVGLLLTTIYSFAMRNLVKDTYITIEFIESASKSTKILSALEFSLHSCKELAMVSCGIAAALFKAASSPLQRFAPQPFAGTHPTAPFLLFIYC